LICHFNGLEAAKAAKEAGMNATLKHKAGGNLSIHERLHMAKHNLSSLRKQIVATKKMVNAIPPYCNGNAGALYECNDCGYCTPFVRYDEKLEFITVQKKCCINPSCTRERSVDSRAPNAKGIAKHFLLPSSLKAKNNRWSFKEAMTGSTIMEYLEKREEACKEKIARLEVEAQENDQDLTAIVSQSVTVLVRVGGDVVTGEGVLSAIVSRPVTVRFKVGGDGDDEIEEPVQPPAMATATVVSVPHENRKRKRLMEDMSPTARSRYPVEASEREDKIRREIRRLEKELREDKLVEIEDMYNVNDFKDPFPFLS
jgi:hypothetical protein